jgi:hypothetical protein
MRFRTILLGCVALGAISSPAAAQEKSLDARVAELEAALAAYHIGNGWFGGFLPTISFAMVASSGDIYYGLWYPIIAAAITAVIGLFFLPETHRRSIDD